MAGPEEMIQTSEHTQKHTVTILMRDKQSAGSHVYDEDAYCRCMPDDLVSVHACVYLAAAVEVLSVDDEVSGW